MSTLYIALLCKQQKNFYYSEFLGRQFSINPSSIYFRGKGWPGNTGDERVQISFSMVAGLAFGKRLWRISGCKYCGDCIGKNCADLTMCDPWGLKDHVDPLGKTLLFIWSSKGEELLSNAISSLERYNLDVSKALYSIDWNNYQNKIKQIEFYNNTFRNGINRFLFSMHLLHTRLFEKLLVKVRFSPFVLRILAKIPFIY